MAGLLLTPCVNYKLSFKSQIQGTYFSAFTSIRNKEQSEGKGKEIRYERMKDAKIRKGKETGTIKVEGSRGRVESRTVSRRPESEALFP